MKVKIVENNLTPQFHKISQIKNEFKLQIRSLKCRRGQTYCKRQEKGK